MKSEWHVVHVLSRTEKKVAERLENSGFFVYVPIQKCLRQWSDRKKWVDMIVLSGYVFVKIPRADHHQVLETTGVSRFLKFEGKPVIISETEMARFQKFVEKAQGRPIEFSDDHLPIGTVVTIQTGQFKGVSGRVAMYKGKHKLKVQLSHIGNFSIDLAPDEVAAQT